ncbi:MAG TPA: peptidylprolyl isomerase [Verrucomicrobiae bacterium]|jgi:cyclophilin family peptidyl-prolyl cis-trans isomerase
MNRGKILNAVWLFLAFAFPLLATPVIDPINNATIPAGKSLIIPITATSPNGRPLAFTASSSTNRITVMVNTNNSFWKMSVVQAAPSNAPGAFLTPFHGGTTSVTNVGDLTFMLFRDVAPVTVNVIQGLTQAGFYTTNTIFHRVVPGFVIQGGDPGTNGLGGPSFNYDDEFNASAIFSGNGQLALANSGKDTDGSQFFITAGPQRFLDFGYTLFGQLLRGFNVLTNVLNTPADTNSRPRADVIITQASFVPDTTDTILTLTGTNLAGVAGIISVIADDGAGGRTTNSFTAATVTDTQDDQPFINGNIITNVVAPVNSRLTNLLTATDISGDALYWFPYYGDDNAAAYGTNSIFNPINGQLQCIVVPNSNYVGSLSFTLIVSANPQWNLYVAYGYPSSAWPPYDEETYTFTFGDTAFTAVATNFTIPAMTSFTNQLLATFTNGIPDSSATNFTTIINWGDNLINHGIITTNLSGWKEVRGAHTYPHPGNYPVYVTIQSSVGASTTVIATANVPPTLNFGRMQTNNLVRWPAWASAYQLQSSTDLMNWQATTNLPALVGYENVVTNKSLDSTRFFRLKQ